MTSDGHATLVGPRQGRSVAATETSPIGEFDCPSIASTLLKSVNSIAEPSKKQSRHPNEVTRTCCSESTKSGASATRRKAMKRYWRACMPPYHEIRSAPVKQETREEIKRRARRLINTSFLAMIDNGDGSREALQITRNLLQKFIAEPSWRHRPVIKSFLDCAEIAVSVSLAYDWLYDKLSPDERQEIEQCLLRHVLEPALTAYDDRTLQWPKRRDNCALVSNSGIVLASLAMLERSPSISTPLIEHCVASSLNVFEAFAPDGAWPEGLSYWSLAMRYAGLMVAALESTLGRQLWLGGPAGFRTNRRLRAACGRAVRRCLQFRRLRVSIRSLAAGLARSPLSATSRLLARA